MCLYLTNRSLNKICTLVVTAVLVSALKCSTLSFLLVILEVDERFSFW